MLYLRPMNMSLMQSGNKSASGDSFTYVFFFKWILNSCQFDSFQKNFQEKYASSVCESTFQKIDMSRLVHWTIRIVKITNQNTNRFFCWGHQVYSFHGV